MSSQHLLWDCSQHLFPAFENFVGFLHINLDGYKVLVSQSPSRKTVGIVPLPLDTEFHTVPFITAP